MQVKIYTDGACSGNPGPGGAGVVIQTPAGQIEISAYEAHTTTNRMELLGAILGLEYIEKPAKVVLTSDSKYVIDGISKWIHGWEKRNWTNVKNRDLWEQLDAATQDCEIQWQWVKGHNGHLENERCDELAREAIFNQTGHISSSTSKQTSLLALLKYTPNVITTLQANQIFVFGSNESGRHGKGAAKTALKWGAICGQSEGLAGQTYALPTVNASISEKLPISRIKESIKLLLEVAIQNPHKQFLVTEVGCGLAGYTVTEIGLLFRKALVISNIVLPRVFHIALETETFIKQAQAIGSQSLPKK